MNIIKAYGRGFKNSLRHPRMILLIFAITLLLGLSLALPFFFSFDSAVGSAAVDNLDYTTFTELQNFHSWNLDSILGQSRFSVLIFWLLMIFFVGGIVRTFNREDFTVSTFFSGAGVNFFRFLLCDIIMLFAQLVTACVLFGVARFVLSLFDNVVTETPLFWAYGVAAFIFACSIVLLLMISDYAKFYMEMAETGRVLKAIGKATKFVFNNFLRTYFLYALLLVAPIVALILYKLTFDKIGMNTMFGIIAMFVVQQIFILLRVWFRVWSLSSQFELYADDYVQVISYDLDTTRIEKQTVETNIQVSDYDPVVVTLDGENTSIEKSERVVVNTSGDTFEKLVDSDGDPIDNSVSKVVETKTVETTTVETTTIETVKEVVAEPEKVAESETVIEIAPETEAASETKVVSETETKVITESETKAVSEPETKTENEPEVEEQLSKFYQQDQGDGTQSNLADLTPSGDDKKVEGSSDKKEDSVDRKEDSAVPETVVINSEGDTFTKIVDNDNDEAETQTTTQTVTVVTTETTTDTNVSILGEPIQDQPQDAENQEEEIIAYQELSPDDLEDADIEEPANDDDDNQGDVDEETLSQFYAQDQDQDAESNLAEPETERPEQPEVVDIYDMDESLGSAVPLDVDDDDDSVTTVTTTTTTTTTTVTTTTETSVDDDEPKVVKIYTEQEMKEIARQQLESAGVEPDMALTEVVSEDSPEGVISGEMHGEEEFVELGLTDGEDFNDPDSEAMG